jgi:hypothetical protein
VFGPGQSTVAMTTAPGPGPRRYSVDGLAHQVNHINVYLDRNKGRSPALALVLAALAAFCMKDIRCVHIRCP